MEEGCRCQFCGKWYEFESETLDCELECLSRLTEGMEHEEETPHRYDRFPDY